MIHKKFVLALASVLCLSSFVCGQDFGRLQGDVAFAFTQQTTQLAVTSLPADFIEEVAAPKSYEESNTAQEADFLVLLGIGGFFLIGTSAAGICFALRKRAMSSSKPVTLIGV